MSRVKKINRNSFLNKRGEVAASISRLSNEIEAGRGRSSTISLFEAAVLIAKRLPQKAQTDTDDLFDLGAKQLLSKLQSGEAQATGINVQSRLRETITHQHWECAAYDISEYEPHLQHYLDFLDMHKSDEGGFGGSLTLAGTTKPAWVYITVPASLVSDTPTAPPDAAVEQLALPKLTAGQENIRWAIERLRRSSNGLPSKPADRDRAIQECLKNANRSNQTPRVIQAYLKLERLYPALKSE